MFSSIDNIIHKALWKLTEQFPHRTRDIKVNGQNYLRRFYLTPRRLDEHAEETNDYLGFGVYLHYFYRGDEDRELHNHPWKNALSFILTGGYDEERKSKESNDVHIRTVRRFTFNKITNDDFHRVSKRAGAEHVWTLFMTGERIQNWGFWDREQNRYIPHEEFVNMADQGYEFTSR